MCEEKDLEKEAESAFEKIQAAGGYELSDNKSRDYWIDGYVFAMRSRQAAIRGSLPTNEEILAEQIRRTDLELGEGNIISKTLTEDGSSWVECLNWLREKWR